MSVHEVNKSLGVQVVQEEWAAYLCFISTNADSLPLAHDLKSVAAFWRDKALTRAFHSVEQAAQLALNIPTVVTGCDADFYAGNAIFDNRQALKRNMREWESIRRELEWARAKQMCGGPLLTLKSASPVLPNLPPICTRILDSTLSRSPSPPDIVFDDSQRIHIIYLPPHTFFLLKETLCDLVFMLVYF